MSGVPLNPDEHERNTEVDRVKLEIGYSLDMPLAEEGLYWFRKAQKEREARERAERALERLIGCFADGAECPEICPLLENGNCAESGLDCESSLKAWAFQAKEVKADE